MKNREYLSQMAIRNLEGVISSCPFIPREIWLTVFGSYITSTYARLDLSVEELDKFLKIMRESFVIGIEQMKKCEHDNGL